MLSYHSFTLYFCLSIIVSVKMLKLVNILSDLIPDFGNPNEALWFTCSLRLLNYLPFQSWNDERTWQRLFQKHVMSTK